MKVREFAAGQAVPIATVQLHARRCPADRSGQPRQVRALAVPGRPAPLPRPATLLHPQPRAGISDGKVHHRAPKNSLIYNHVHPTIAKVAPKVNYPATATRRIFRRHFPRTNTPSGAQQRRTNILPATKFVSHSVSNFRAQGIRSAFTILAIGVCSPFIFCNPLIAPEQRDTDPAWRIRLCDPTHDSHA